MYIRLPKAKHLGSGKLLVDLLKHVVFILAVWIRHSLVVNENSWKERSSHLEGTHNLQSSGLLCILPFLSALQPNPLAFDGALPGIQL